MSYNKAEVRQSLLDDEGKFEIVRKEGKSDMWKYFGRVVVVDTQERLKMYACFECKHTYTDAGGGTGNMSRHRCPLANLQLSQLLADATPMVDVIKKEELTLEDIVGTAPSTSTEGVLDEPAPELKVKEEVPDPEPEPDFSAAFRAPVPSIKVKPKLTNRDYTPKVDVMRMLADNSPEIVLMDHKKYDTMSIIHRYQEDERRTLMQTMFIICKTCNQFLSNEQGGHLKRHLQQTCPGQQVLTSSSRHISRTPNDVKQIEMKESLASTIAAYCLETFKDFKEVLADQPFVKMMRRLTTYQKEFPNLVDLTNEALNTYSSFKEKTTSKVRAAIELLELDLIVDFGQRIPNVVAVYASFADGSDDANLIPLGFNIKRSTSDPYQIFQQIVETCSLVELTEEDVKRCCLVSESAPGMHSCGEDYMSGYYQVGPRNGSFTEPVSKRRRTTSKEIRVDFICDKYRPLLERWKKQTVYGNESKWVLLTAALLL